MDKISGNPDQVCENGIYRIVVKPSFSDQLKDT